MAKRSLIKNYSFNVMYRMVDLVIPLLTTPYLSRTLGDYGIGVFSYTNAIAATFIMTSSAGINIYGQREVACFQCNKEKRSELFWEIAFVKAILSIASCIVYWIIFSNDLQYGMYFKVLTISLVANAIDISWYFQGVEEFQVIAIKNTLFRFVGVITIFLFVHDENSLLLYIILYSLPIFLGNLTLWPYLKNEILPIKHGHLHLRRHIKPTFSLFIPQIAIELYTVVDKVMLGGLASCIEEVSYYEQAQKIVRVGVRFLTAFGAVMMSRASNEYAERGDKGLKENLSISFQFTFFLGFPIMFGLLGIASSLVPWFFGSRFAPVKNLIVSMSPAVIMIGVSNIIGTQFLIPTHQHKQYTISVISGAAVNIVLNTLLIPQYNAWGAAIASVISESVVALVQVIVVWRRISILHYFKRGWKSFVSGLIMLVIICIIRCFVRADFICTIIQIIVGFFSYIICSWSFGSKEIKDFLFR